MTGSAVVLVLFCNSGSFGKYETFITNTNILFQRHPTTVAKILLGKEVHFMILYYQNG